MPIAFTCPECGGKLRARAELAGLDVRCGHCSTRVAVPRANSAPARPGAALPWRPAQAFAASFLFGPLAGGLTTGINFARMGRRAWLLPCALLGLLLFLLLVALVLRFPALPRELGVFAGLGVAAVFLLLQKEPFTTWQDANWAPSRSQERYNPGRLGQLLLIGLASLAVEVALVFLAVLLFDRG
jgi:hypothetical protein